MLGDCGTHYEKLPGAAPMADGWRVGMLCAAQLGIGMPLTLLTGGVAGALAAAAVRRRSFRRTDADPGAAQLRTQRGATT